MDNPTGERERARRGGHRRRHAGDGDLVHGRRHLDQCGSGTPYDESLPISEQSSACSHTYEHSSAHQSGLAYAATVTVRWRLAWTVAGAAGGGPLGTIDRTTSFSVPVAEIQTVNVGPRGET